MERTLAIVNTQANGKKLMGTFLISSLTLVPHAGLNAPGKWGKGLLLMECLKFSNQGMEKGGAFIPLEDKVETAQDQAKMHYVSD